MPDMDGYTVCSRLKQMEATRQIPVIFVTAVDDAEAEAQSFSLGAADYITKPVKVSRVLARVKTHIALYRQQQSLRGMFRDVIGSPMQCCCRMRKGRSCASTHRPSRFWLHPARIDRPGH